MVGQGDDREKIKWIFMTNFDSRCEIFLWIFIYNGVLRFKFIIPLKKLNQILFILLTFISFLMDFFLKIN